MEIFETILALLLGATILSALAKRVHIPYPTLLALAGTLVTFLPNAPRLDLPPQLILALFVAPVLFDAAFDTSLRDLRDNWRPISALVLIAVSLTTIAVAAVARTFIPDLPWGAVIALGALLAPPDAIAALAVLREVNPPHRIRTVLEGESLLNDASALLIYRLAVAAVAAGSFNVANAVPTFALVVVGSIVVGWLLAWPAGKLIRRITDAPNSVIVQFVSTFGVWLLAERLGLSGVVTIVVFALTLAHGSGAALPAQLRIPSFAIWETATRVLNVLAFTLIGLQIRPILDPLSNAQRMRYALAALAILATVIIVRLIWVMSYSYIVQWKNRIYGFHARRSTMAPPTFRGSLVIGWCGMRGMVTLAAALALPIGFPGRDFILLTSFVVVLGTLVLQGVTLRPLLLLLRLPQDTIRDSEIRLARKMALKAALTELDSHDTHAALRLKFEYAEAMDQARDGGDPRDIPGNALRQEVVAASRRAIDDLRQSGAIGDQAYRLIEEELDWLELASRPPRPES